MAEEVKDVTMEEPKVEGEHATAEGADSSEVTSGEAVDSAEGEEEKKEPEPEEPKEEVEEKDTRAKVKKGAVHLNPGDTTVNCYIADDGTVMSGLASEGWQQLLMGARATHGIKKGRYYYEVKLLDIPRQMRIGVTTEEEIKLFGGGYDTITFEGTGDVTIPPPPVPEPTENDENKDSENVEEGEEKKEETKPAVAPTRPRPTPTRLSGLRWNRSDVIGILVNLQKGFVNENTITLFVNGKRVAKPQPIPEHMHGKTLFPLVCSKQATVKVNFGPGAWCPLDFTPRMVAEGANADLHHASKKEPAHAEVIMIVTQDKLQDVARALPEKFPGYDYITLDAMTDWAFSSGLGAQGGRPGNFGLQATDYPGKVIPTLDRRRKFIYACSAHLTEKQRKETANLFGSKVKMDVIVYPLDELFKRDNYTAYAEVSLPNAEEGPYHSVKYEGNPKIAALQGNLDVWKKAQRLKSRIDDLKSESTVYPDYMAAFAKHRKFMDKATAEQAVANRTKEIEDAKVEVAAARDAALAKAAEDGTDPEEIADPSEDPDADKEYRIMEEFTPEDWILAKLRVEMHAILHAFKEDVQKVDPERNSFPAAHYFFYLQKTYDAQAKGLWHSDYGCEDWASFLEMLADIVEADEDGMLQPKLPKDASVEAFIDLAEEARVMRQDRVDAGDENAALKFKAMMFGRMNHSVDKGSLKGRGKYSNYNRDGESPRTQRGGQPFQQRGNGFGKGFGKKGGYQQDNRGGYGQDTRQYGGGGYGSGTQRTPGGSYAGGQQAGGYGGYQGGGGGGFAANKRPYGGTYQAGGGGGGYGDKRPYGQTRRM